MADRPRINLSWETHWCPRHLEPLRPDWPKGAGIAMVKLLDAALADERIQAAAPKDAEGKGMTDALDGVLREFSPLCCFVGDEKLRVVYEQAGIHTPNG